MKMTRRNAEQLTVRGYVRDSIRASIFAGELKPGDRLAQAVVAQELQVSTTPVREAFRELATEGLLRLDPHRGAVVRGLDAEELHDVHELRTLLEPHVMRKAVPRLTEDQLRRAEEIQEEMLAVTSVSEWAELNRQFHRVFLDATGSERLARIVRGLQDSYAAFIVSTVNRDPGRRRRANDEHRALIAAARERDAERATRILLEHIDVPLEAAQDFLQPPPHASGGDGSTTPDAV